MGEVSKIDEWGLDNNSVDNQILMRGKYVLTITKGDRVMVIILGAFYGLVGLVGLFIAISYAVSLGIDNSKSVKALRTELNEIKEQLKNSEGK